MDPIEIIAQAIGIVAMLFVTLSYQSKQQKTIFALQLIGSILFVINFLMIGAIVGGLMNIIAIVRALVFLFKDKLKADRLPWLIGFVASYIAVYVLMFTLFGKELTVYNLLIQLLPVIGMTACQIGIHLGHARTIRYLGYISSPSWLIYNIITFSIGAIICESINLISITVGILRFDIKKKTKQ